MLPAQFYRDVPIEREDGTWSRNDINLTDKQALRTRERLYIAGGCESERALAAPLLSHHARLRASQIRFMAHVRPSLRRRARAQRRVVHLRRNELDPRNEACRVARARVGRDDGADSFCARERGGGGCGMGRLS